MQIEILEQRIGKIRQPAAAVVLPTRHSPLKLLLACEWHHPHLRPILGVIRSGARRDGSNRRHRTREVWRICCRPDPGSRAGRRVVASIAAMAPIPSPPAAVVMVAPHAGDRDTATTAPCCRRRRCRRCRPGVGPDEEPVVSQTLFPREGALEASRA
jgi:hypothetical protein